MDCVHLLGPSTGPRSCCFPLVARKTSCTEKRRVGPAFKENPLKVPFIPASPAWQQNGRSGAPGRVHRLRGSGSGRSRTLVPLVLSDYSSAALDMQIYVHTVCVLHRLVEDDKNQVLFYAWRLSGVSLCCEGSAQARTQEAKVTAAFRQFSGRYQDEICVCGFRTINQKPVGADQSSSDATLHQFLSSSKLERWSEISRAGA